MMSARNPLANTCAIMVSSQRMPAETCRPWHPTSVKNAERKALRVGPAPRATRSANSRNSSARNPSPSRQVTAMRSGTSSRLRTSAAMLAKPQVKLDSSRKAVSDRDVLEIEQLRAVRAAGGLPRQHRIGREEAGEHHDVAEQEDPEAVAGHDPLRRRPLMRPSACRPMRIAMSVKRCVGHDALPAAVTRRGAPRDWRGRCARPRRPE